MILSVSSVFAFSLDEIRNGIDVKQLNIERTKEMKLFDSTMYLKSFKDKLNEAGSLATGACFGPFYDLSYKAKQYGNLFALCGATSVDQKGLYGLNAGINVIDIHGIQAGVYYDIINNGIGYSISASVLDIINTVKNYWSQS
jgi:glycyl-tRNA synthetase alpha subunit